MAEWKDIVDYEGLYQVSNEGRIRRNKNGHILNHRFMDTGYDRCVLYKKGNPKTLMVHRIVALSFIDNKDNKPIINHKDSNPKNNNVENLEWVTAKENTWHSINKGRQCLWGEKHPSALIKEKDARLMIKLCSEYAIKRKAVAIIFGVKRHIVDMLMTNRSWKHIDRCEVLN
jgi:hypothetical protein